MREILLGHLASNIARINRAQARVVARIDINKYRTPGRRDASVRIGNAQYSFSEITPINPLLGYAFGWVTFVELQLLDTFHVILSGKSLLKGTSAGSD